METVFLSETWLYNKKDHNINFYHSEYPRTQREKMVALYFFADYG
jgi:hypothetical protein